MRKSRHRTVEEGEKNQQKKKGPETHVLGDQVPIWQDQSSRRVDVRYREVELALWGSYEHSYWMRVPTLNRTRGAPQHWLKTDKQSMWTRLYGASKSAFPHQKLTSAFFLTGRFLKNTQIRGVFFQPPNSDLSVKNQLSKRYIHLVCGSKVRREISHQNEKLIRFLRNADYLALWAWNSSFTSLCLHMTG